MKLILSVAICQAVVALYLLFTNKSDNKPSIYAFLFNSIVILHLTIKLSLLVFVKDTFVFNNLVTGFSYLYGLLIYLYIRSYIGVPVKEKAFFRIHLVLFAVISLVYVYIALHTLLNPEQVLLVTYRKFITWIVIVFLYSYLIASTRYLFFTKYETENKRFYELKAILVVMLAATLLSLTISFIPKIQEQSTYVTRGVFYAGLIITCILFLKHYLMTANARVHMGENKEDEEDIVVEKYRVFSLDEEKLKAYGENLESYLIKSKAYLNPDLTLESLAAELKMPKHHLSQTLTKKFNKNFYQLINELRIKEVIKRLEAGINSPILEIAFACGFNSKSSFNNYFKKLTGLTPSDYRLKNIPEM